MTIETIHCQIVPGKKISPSYEGSKLVDSLCSDPEPRDGAELGGEGRSGQACVNWELLARLCRLAGRACGGGVGVR